jgi:hypothetical protein
MSNFAPANSMGFYLEPNIELPMDPNGLKEALVMREIATASLLNLKEIAIYDTAEFLNGQQWFDPTTPLKSRTAFRKVIDFGSLPNATTKSVAHGITNVTLFTRIYGAATNGSVYIPIPFASVLAEPIEIYVDATDVSIAANIDRSGFTAYVVLEYLKT